MKNCAFIVGIAGLALSAQAGLSGDIVRDLGGGWQAVISGAEAEVLDLVSDGVSGNTLVVEKFAEFRSIDPFTGNPSGLTITFRQTAADANTASRIVITDELISNFTGVNWTAFRMLLVDSGQVSWNQTLTTGVSILPFTNISYPSATELVMSGGNVANGTTWRPGLAAGGFVIDVNLAASAPVSFQLKEIPVPTPGAGALLGCGVLLASRRRR